MVFDWLLGKERRRKGSGKGERGWRKYEGIGRIRGREEGKGEGRGGEIGKFEFELKLTYIFSKEGSDPIQATFELNDTLYAKANVPATNEVYLWLGVCLEKKAICSIYIIFLEIVDKSI